MSNTMVYTVVVEQTATGWSAYLPDLPGCVATGHTRDTVERAIRDAVAMHLEGLREHGDAVPRPQAYALTVDVAAA